MMSSEDFSMRISMLASGSSGNVTYVQTPQREILVDAGLSGKKIEQLMASIGRSMHNIDAIFVTHEHSDHIKGLGVLARRYKLAIYANEETWLAIGDKCGKIPLEQRFVMEPGELLTFGDLDVASFGVSHDAAQAQFYAFQKDNKQFAMMTDLGYVSDRQRGFLRNCDAYLMESNHDTDMLRMGRYPWHLKQRILSDSGHLSNEAGAEALSEMIGDKTQHVYLGHLSKDNNLPELAMQTVTSVLRDHDLGVNDQFHIHNTHPDEASDLLTL
ncbi:MBL fold metallo-hydrolase [Aerococcus sanguinicola]|uniref:MBL fold metallo-hydrolase n=2 Tax=Aerococcus sanguinicola TaxID=119206 RepID=A0A109RDM9_9LACT|nr:MULTISPECIES: MBL fold metallo-hydrolase [Aerococcus]AMB94341.1 metallohydrolase [Aerococcus sanguinicola]MDK7049873.1 MBL fold metallo-hydrolase [Aerococcus sanguinicola]OFT92853.1 metallohydrolase [Aerococcus sp. HMSC23C02]PKZ22520.1 MBL fold metallo-hydrolase [Aerococcus sanguinicola]